MMRKVKKLVTKPNQFFRDYFLKRAPLHYGENIELLPQERGLPTPVKKSASKKVASHQEHKTDNVIEDLYPITFPIDIVYTWVNSDDEEFNESRLYHQGKTDSETLKSKSEVTDIARFQSRDELKYSIRSVLEYAPWVNHIYIVTNGQVPKWLDKSFEKVSVVTHAEILDEQFLPTFNSHVIESALYKIPNLSEHYLYFNDDVMITRPLSPHYFFTSSGLAKLFVTNVKLSNSTKNHSDTPTQWAAKNVRELLYQHTGFWSENLFAHTFHPQLKSVHAEIEQIWNKDVNECRKNKFRENSDLNIATFMHHHYALITGKALVTRTKCMYFNIRSLQAPKHYATLLQRKGTDFAPHSMCLNDHVSGKKNLLEDYEKQLSDFLESYYPFASEAEMTLPSKQELADLMRHKQYQEICDIVSFFETDINPQNQNTQYAFYYYGAASYFLYQTDRQPEYLKTAERNLSIFCAKMKSHKLAAKYLEAVRALMKEE